MLVSLVQSLVGSFELREYNEGMVIAWAGEVDDCMYVVKSGQCLLTPAAQPQQPQDQALQGSPKLARVHSLPGDKLEAGARHGEQALLVAQARTTTLVASKDGTQVRTLVEMSFAPLGPPSLRFKQTASEAVGRRFNSWFFRTWSLDRHRVK